MRRKGGYKTLKGKKPHDTQSENQGDLTDMRWVVSRECCGRRVLRDGVMWWWGEDSYSQESQVLVEETHDESMNAACSHHLCFYNILFTCAVLLDL